MPQHTVARQATGQRSIIATPFALLFALALAFCAGMGTTAHAQPAQGSGGTKSKAKLTPLRSNETKQGSQLTITSTSPLNDYSAYRSGDRFYVRIPNADAGAVRGGLNGRGFADARVQKLGEDVILSFRVQPGAKPRVNQRFNKLDVVFAASENSGAGAKTNDPATTRASDPAATTQPAATQPHTTPTATATDSQRNPATREQPADATQLPEADTSLANGENNPGAPPDMNPEGAVAETPAQGERQVADARQTEGASAPVKITTEPSSGQPSFTLGTAIRNNWPLALIATLLLVGLGLFLVARRTAAARPSSAPLPGQLDVPRVTAPATSTASVTTAAPVVPLTETLKEAPPASLLRTVETKPETAVPPVIAVVATQPKPSHGKADKKKKRKKDKKKGAPVSVAPAPVLVEQKSVEMETEDAPAELLSETPAQVEESIAPEESVAQPIEEGQAGESFAEVAPAEEAAQPFVAVGADLEPVEEQAAIEPPVEEDALVEKFAAESLAEESVVEESIVEEPTDVVSVGAVLPALIEPARVEPAQATSEIEVAAPVMDADSVQEETRRLLAGEDYDRNLVAVSDALMRQLVASELLAALAGRQSERRERARTAFVEYGYFNETVRDLHLAEAPAERASAARSLGLVGDHLATSHLVAALEDPSMEVRRAAVDALAEVRDPSAIEPLKALAEREKTERIKLPRRLVQNAIEVCSQAPADVPHTLAETSAAAIIAQEETTGPAEAVEEFSEATPAPETSSIEPSATIETAPPVEFAGEPAAAVEEAEVEHTTSVEPALETPEFEAAIEEASSETVVAPPRVEDVAETFESEAVVESSLVDREELPALATQEETRSFMDDSSTEMVAAHLEEPAAVEETPAVVAEEHRPDVSEEAQANEARQQLFQTEHEMWVADAESLPTSEEFAAELEERAALEEEASAAQPELEFESHRAETIHEPVAQPVEQIETTPDEAGAEEWVVLDMDEAGSFIPTSQPGLPSERMAAFEPVELSDEHKAIAPVVPSEEPEVVTQQSAMPDATAIELLSSSQTEITPHTPVEVEPERFRAARPAAPAEGKAIAPFVEDDMSAVPKSIQLRLSSEESEERAIALADLAHVGSDDAFRAICSGFDDASADVRNAAARSLYNLQEDRAECFTRALRESGPQRRRAIGAAIASSGLAGEAISHLTGESREKTYDAFSLLFLMAKAGEVQPLLRAVEAHPDNEVRLAVVKLLALSGQKEVVPAFRRLAVRDALPADVRAALMEAVYQIGSSQPVS